MKQIIILCMFVALTACTTDVDDIQVIEPIKKENSVSIEQQLLATGWEIYKMHCMCPDLTISDDIIDRLEEDNSDLSAVIDMVNYLSEQTVFGDTIAETDAWEKWCELYQVYSSH